MADEPFETEGNQVIQRKSGLNFFVFTKKKVLTTERLVADPDLATILAVVLNERADFKELIRDTLPHIRHDDGCDCVLTDCTCGAQKYRDAAVYVGGLLAKFEDE